MKKKVYAFPNKTTPGRPLIFSPKRCTGCNICVNACQVDIMIPSPVKGDPPIVLYPEECWYCGACVSLCPRSGAIKLNHPLNQRVRWKRKETGEHFRV